MGKGWVLWKVRLLWKMALTTFNFSTNRQNNNFINCYATWIHNHKAEGNILKYSEDETRLWERAKRAILCLRNQLFLFIPCWDWTHTERNIHFFHCQQLVIIMPKELSIPHPLTSELLDSLGFVQQHGVKLILKRLWFHGHHWAMLWWPRRRPAFPRCVVCTMQA